MTALRDHLRSHQRRRHAFTPPILSVAVDRAAIPHRRFSVCTASLNRAENQSSRIKIGQARQQFLVHVGVTCGDLKSPGAPQDQRHVLTQGDRGPQLPTPRGKAASAD